ncbi:MAG TPA: hypothetical protein VGN80_09850 [Devosiaceae bacterium]|jgi:hypothetical protein|nr:hypothetical protein [Devosiaceae bacterium]
MADVRKSRAGDEIVPALQRLLRRYFDRYGLRNKEIADALTVSDSEMSGLMKGTRNFQRHHIARIIEVLRTYRSIPKEAQHPDPSSDDACFVPWTRSDEYVLLWTFVHEEEPDLSRGVDPDLSFERRQFALGGHKQEAFVYEFNPQGYRRYLLQSSLETSPLQLPAEEDLRVAFPKIEVEQQEELKRRRGFNGTGLTLSYIQSTRTDGDEVPKVAMRFKRSDYNRRLTTRTLFSRLDPERRDRILGTIPYGVQEEFCGGFGAVISIIAADDKLLFFQRSEEVGGDRGAYDCTITEAMDGERDYDPRGQPSPVMNAVRGLAQEAALSGLEDDVQHLIKFHGFLCRARYYEWSIYGTLNLSGTDLTAGKLIDNAVEEWRRRKPEWDLSTTQSAEGLSTSFMMARDAYEFQRYTAVPFTVTDVVRFIATNPMTDYAFINAIMTLVSVRNVSMQAIDQELRLYPPRPAPPA